MDYLRGTVPPVLHHTIEDWETGEVVTFAEPPQVEIEHLLGEMTHQNHSIAKGYDHSATLPCGGTVHWHSTMPEQRVLINLGGEALANLGMHPLTLMQKLNALKFQVTRMDWAKDDTEGLLDLAVIWQKIIRGEVATRFRKWGRNDSGVIGENRVDGETIYIGNRKSESFIRCYDKAAQQAEKKNCERVPHWVRVELEIKKRKAQELWTQILDANKAGKDVAELILKVMLGLVDFKDLGEDTNKWRWPTCSWWTDFLGVNEKVRITVPKSEVTLDRAKDWLQNQVSITAAMVKEIEPGFIDEMLQAGVTKRQKNHEAKLKRWKVEQANIAEPIERLNRELQLQTG